MGITKTEFYTEAQIELAQGNRELVAGLVGINSILQAAFLVCTPIFTLKSCFPCLELAV